MTDSSYNENMAKPIRHKATLVRPVDLDALNQGSDSLSYHAPIAPSELPITSIYEHGEGLECSESGQAGQANEGGQGTGGRSGETFATPLETAKLLSPNSQPLLSNPPSTSPSHMPVLGVPMGVHQKEVPKVVESCHTGGIHSKNSPILGHKGSDLVTTSLNIPYSPDVEEPSSTEETSVASPFITGNGRIDRRTAFTQYCRLGEGRTYVKVAEIMGLSLDAIKDWAKEDNWENAYRERVTADIVQVAKEENIHDYLDAKKAMISLIKGKVMEAQAGKDVFKNTKEMIDTMMKLEELTGASSANSVKPGQIFVIIERSEWEAREQMNEQARKEEAKA